MALETVKMRNRRVFMREGGVRLIYSQQRNFPLLMLLLCLYYCNLYLLFPVLVVVDGTAPE